MPIPLCTSPSLSLSLSLSTLKYTSGFQSTSSIRSDPKQVEPKEIDLEVTGTNSSRSRLAQIEQQREAWCYKVDEIDPSVVDELPPDIQEEVRAWIRPHKRPNVVKKGSSIAHYFLPAKNR
jgi:DNA polymerase eta